MKHEDLYARTWQSDFGKNIFDNDLHEFSPPNPREMTVEFNQTISETCRTLGTTQNSSPENFTPNRRMALRNGCISPHKMCGRNDCRTT